MTVKDTPGSAHVGMHSALTTPERPGHVTTGEDTGQNHSHQPVDVRPTGSMTRTVAPVKIEDQR